MNFFLIKMLLNLTSFDCYLLLTVYLIMKTKNKIMLKLSVLWLIPVVVHKALVKEVTVVIGRMSMIASLNIHLVSHLLQSSFERIARCELPRVAIWWLYVLHIFFCFYLNHGRFSEYHSN